MPCPNCQDTNDQLAGQIERHEQTIVTLEYELRASVKECDGLREQRDKLLKVNDALSKENEALEQQVDELTTPSSR